MHMLDTLEVILERIFPPDLLTGEKTHKLNITITQDCTKNLNNLAR